ncbi:Cytoplasmic glyoxalase II [Xylographa trunciseda]|nr:Cytoplasmic glyoxalase II [Xylographa trunciseda]
MAHPVLNFHPWDDTTILRALRAKFYPPQNYAGPDLRMEACKEVAMWKMKRPIPDDLEATGLITEAILNDKPDETSTAGIDLMYGAAFSRFVTLLVDGVQKRSHKENMYDVGLNIGLPARFVELRHEINHGSLPPLATLRTYAQQALTWLYHDYWKQMGVARPRKFEHSDPAEAFRLSLEDDLTKYRKNAFDALTAKGPAVKAAAQKKNFSDMICAKVAKFCSKDIEKLGIVIRELLEVNQLVPSNKRPGSSITDRFRVWDTLLGALSRKQQNFLHTLTATMISRLVQPDLPQIKSDGYREGVGQWLLYIYTDDCWQKSRDVAHLKIQTLMVPCLADPCFWTLRLALAVITKDVWKKHRPLYEKMILEAMEADKGSNVGVGDEDAMDMADGNDNEAAEGLGATVVENDEPAAYGLDTVATALLEVEDDGKEEEEAVGAPPALTYTLCLRTMNNSWYTAPVGEGSSNNYAYLVVDDKTKDAVIIDPANPPEVAPVLKQQIDSGKINLTSIINTHHHWDHAGGNSKILEQFKGLPVIGGKQCEAVTRTPKDGETFKIGEGITVKALYTPCHTQDSICWYMEDGSEKVVFTGDTLFIGGCGRFFEGTPAEMNTALNKTLAALPDDTKVYPGHEYTKTNVKFLTTVLQTEPVMKLQSFAENNKETQGKFTIGDEKTYNVFMRLDDPTVQKATGKTEPVDVMGKLREMKNSM